MSGREKLVYTFNVDKWISDLIEAFKTSTENSVSMLGSMIEKSTLKLIESELRTVSTDQAKVIKQNLTLQVKEISSAIAQLLNESMDEQGQILRVFLNQHVFGVPADSVIAVSPLQVPIPISSNSSKESQLTSSVAPPTSKKTSAKARARPVKDVLDQLPEADVAALREVLLQIHKSEYFIFQLKKIVDENDAYIQVLESVLHALLQLDDRIKANDTEPSLQNILTNIQSSFHSLQSMQSEFDKRNIPNSINI